MSRNQAVEESTYSIQQYENIIKILIESHSSHTGKWIASSGFTHYNLKKTRVSDIIDKSDEGAFYVDNDFFKYIFLYKTNLMDLYVNIIREVKSKYACNFYGRIKNEDSILNKLQKKRTEQNGQFSINKVLNDLLGFRMIDKNYEHNVEQLILYLNELKEKEGFRITHKERVNGDYRGYHVYFMGKDSRFFPLELQLWDKNNEIINLDSHETYKKDYTIWPEIYYKG